jgi:hypothetical protein
VSTTVTRTLIYPPRSLLGDYARAGIGVVLTAGLVLLTPAGSIMSWVFGSLALLFLGFAIRTAWRHASRIEFSNERISLFGPGQASFPWDALAAVKLSYYATTSDRQGGWMQLTLNGAGGARIRIDSTLDGFVDVARRVAQAATDNGLQLSPATASNFQALGIAVEFAGAQNPIFAAPDRSRR